MSQLGAYRRRGGSSTCSAPRCAACGRPRPLLCEAAARRCAAAAPLCARCGAPTAWPVGAASNARAAGWRSRRRAPRSRTPAPRATFVRAWKERGLRPLAALAAELVVEVVPRPAADVITYIPPDGDRSLRRGHHPARSARPRARRRAGSSSAAPLLDRTRPVARQAGAAPRRAAPERPRRVRGAPGARRAARDGGARRRRLHDGRDGRCRRLGAACGRCPEGARRHVRPRDPVAARSTVALSEPARADVRGDLGATELRVVV